MPTATTKTEAKFLRAREDVYAAINALPAPMSARDRRENDRLVARLVHLEAILASL